MATQLKLRRGTTVQHSTFTGAAGEVTVDTTKKTAVVHDGATAGGIPLLTENQAQTLTNKTVNLANNTVTGTLAQFNTAVSDADLASLAGAETLSNKTLSSSTINLANNTLTGTAAQFNAAVSDADFAKAGANSDITSLAGLTTALSVAQGGTGKATIGANNVLLGNGTTALQEVAPGASGNVLTSNGTTWVSSAGGSAYAGGKGQVFTKSGTFTVPAGVTAAKVTVVGGGGTGSPNAGAYGGGGGGAVATKYVTGLTPGGTVTVTVGGVSGTSSFGAYCSATGGASTTTSAGGTGGTATGGDINIPGGNGGTYSVGSGGGGAAGGGNGGYGGNGDGEGGSGLFGKGGGNFSVAPQGYGSGGTGSSNATARTGLGGIVIVEW